MLEDNLPNALGGDLSCSDSFHDRCSTKEVLSENSVVCSMPMLGSCTCLACTSLRRCVGSLHTTCTSLSFRCFSLAATGSNYL